MGFVNQEFIEWLHAEMAIRGWKQADLVRKSKISPTAISSILSGLRAAGPEVCNGFARAFDLPPSVVFIKAGLMSPDATGTELLDEIKYKASMLPKQKQKIVIQLLDGLLAGEKTDK